MGKVVTTILIILGLIWLGGGCEDCGDCSGGCDLGCGSCFECSEPVYNGKITLNIHKWDGSVVTVKGHRDSNKSGSIFNYSNEQSTFGSYNHGKRIGYKFGGLYYTRGSSKKYIMSSSNSIYYDTLSRIEDDQEIEVYETWNAIDYPVTYITNDGLLKLEQYYTIGETIEFTQDVQNVYNTELNDRRQVTGYTAYYTDANQQLHEFEWTFGGTLTESLISIYDELPYINDLSNIFVKQNWISDTVKVEFNYGYGNLEPEVITVEYDANLVKYFLDKVDTENREFFGWYIDSAFTTKAPTEIGKEYTTTPLKLYAKHMEFKMIYVDFQDGKSAVEARVYEDGTLSVNTDKDGKDFYGLSDDPASYSRISYAGLTQGQKYYAIYL